MELGQIFTDPEMKQEFIDRFDELAAAAEARNGGLEGLESAWSRRRVENAVDEMTEGTWEPDGSGLEAIVQRFTRPVHLVHGDSFDPPADDFVESEALTKRLDAAAPFLHRAIPSAGRIDLQNHQLAWVGTGWMVAPDVLVTNRHVAEVFARADGDGFVFRKNFLGKQVKASVDWRQEFGSSDESIFRIPEVIWIEPDGSVDVALLRLAEHDDDGADLPPVIDLMSSQEYAAATVGAWIAVVGYPARDTRNIDPNDPLDQQRIFDGIYNVKRLAAGMITAMAGSDLIQHDATTLGGNSGSVVLDLASGKAAALHFGGLRGVANSAVPAPRIAQIVQERAS